jgi:hypothetical protein
MKLRKRKRIAAMAALLIGVSMCGAHAQSTPPDDVQMPPLLPEPAPPMSGTEFATPPMSDGFAALDRDKDGAVTRSEADRNEQVAMVFQRLDESRDGSLDLAEYAQLRKPPAKPKQERPQPSKEEPHRRR